MDTWNGGDCISGDLLYEALFTHIILMVTLFFPPQYLFIYLVALGLGCDMRALVPRAGIKPRPPALGAQSLSHRTTKEVP